MKTAISSFVLLLTLAALPPAGLAADARPDLPQGVSPCETCHGDHGEGNRAESAPRIAAQSEAYLARQLASFADGRRASKVMTPIAKALDENLRNRLAAYYSGLDTAPATAKPGAGTERGRQIAAHGDNGRRIQACDNCHGPGGIGEPPTYPYLGGQQRDYLIAALKAWRDGSRRTDPSAQMPTIAKRLGDEEIAALADYYAAARPPRPATFRVAAPPAAKSPAGQPPGGAAGRPGGETGSVGSEQGSPTTGGAQGPGGGGGTREERVR